MNHHYKETEGMAECMALFRQDMIQAGVIDETVPPMFMTEAVMSYIYKLEEQIKSLKENKARMEWKVSHFSYKENNAGSSPAPSTNKGLIMDKGIVCEAFGRSNWSHVLWIMGSEFGVSNKFYF